MAPMLTNPRSPVDALKDGKRELSSMNLRDSVDRFSINGYMGIPGALESLLVVCSELMRIRSNSGWLT